MSVLVKKSTRVICQGFTSSRSEKTTPFAMYKVTRTQPGVFRG